VIFRHLRCLLLLPAVLSAGSSAAPAAIHVGTTKQLLHDDNEVMLGPTLPARRD
jgi:hypothetical protein